MREKFDEAKTYVSNYLLRFLIVAIFSSLLLFLKNLPYFNIFLTLPIIGIVVWLNAILLLKFSGKTSVFFGLVLLLFSLIMVLFGNTEVAENLMELVFMLLVVGFVQEFKAVLKKRK